MALSAKQMKCTLGIGLRYPPLKLILKNVARKVRGLIHALRRGGWTKSVVGKMDNQTPLDNDMDNLLNWVHYIFVRIDNMTSVNKQCGVPEVVT